MHACMHVYMHIHIYIYIYIHVHIHIHIHIHTYRDVWPSGLASAPTQANVGCGGDPCYYAQSTY